LRTVAESASARGSRVIEVSCGSAAPAPRGCFQRYEVAGLGQRHALLLYQADGVLVLPGGPETFWELMEVLALAHLAQHSKPLGLLNVGGFFTPYLHTLAHLYHTGFTHLDLSQRYLLCATEPHSLVQRLLAHPNWRFGAVPVEQASERRSYDV
ncbi:MAG TPA: LOG family protein, partial [Ktedonobacterales bacterium]|nr:LOG family protein [Ktedonobacterales bacterium]